MGKDITLIMPVRTPHLSYLSAVMQSVLSQTDPAWKMIVVGYSQDDISLTKTVGNDARITWICAPGVSAYGGINMGMKAADTDFVAEILCDDMLAPTAIKTMRLYIDAFPEIDFFHSSRIIIDDDGRNLATCWCKPANKRSDFFDGHVKHMLCWRRQPALDMGGIEEDCLHGADDYDFPWSMFEHGCKFMPVMEPLYTYRDHRSHYRLTTHVPLDKQEADLRLFLRKHGMSDAEITADLEARKNGYLKQALYLNDKDKIEKQGAVNPNAGWRESYRR